MISVKENRRTDNSPLMAYIIVLMAIIIVWFNYVTSSTGISQHTSRNVGTHVKQEYVQTTEINTITSQEENTRTATAEMATEDLPAPASGNIQEQANDSVYDQNNLSSIAVTYDADPDYLIYIADVEKTFDLQPCDLLALIAQESGFHPQTHMDGGSLSYNTTQMKLASAKTAYMAITEYYHMDVAFPTDELLTNDKYYAAFLAGGYLKYLNDSYHDKYEAYTAYNLGINGRMNYYDSHGNFKSPYAVKVADLGESFREQLS